MIPIHKGMTLYMNKPKNTLERLESKVLVWGNRMKPTHYETENTKSIL